MRAAAFSAALTLAAGAGAALPDGWQRPGEDQLASQPHRLADPNRRASASADFDGDGRGDLAVLLKRAQSAEQGLFVRLAADDGWRRLHSVDAAAPDAPLAMSIETMAPGSYRTACGKGYWTCEDGEPALLTATRPVLRYFRYESAASVFVWDEGKTRFERIWLSD